MSPSIGPLLLQDLKLTFIDLVEKKYKIKRFLPLTSSFNSLNHIVVLVRLVNFVIRVGAVVPIQITMLKRLL
jgi:hypothetical protein